MWQAWTCNLFVIMVLALFLPQARGYSMDESKARCGAANKQGYLPSPPRHRSDLCYIGTPSAVRGNGPWTWQCRIPHGLEATCFAAPAALQIVDNTADETSLATIRSEVAQARKLFENGGTQNTTVVLKFRAGVYDFSRNSRGQTIYCKPPGDCNGVPAIDVSDVTPGSKGRLLMLGDGPDQTKFIVSPDQVQFFGFEARRFSVAGIELSQDRLEASQGISLPAGMPAPDGTPNWVGIDIERGFPQMQPYPRGLWTPHKGAGNGRYLRKYLHDASCGIDTSLGQYYYNAVRRDPDVPERWWFRLAKGQGGNPFNPEGGDLIGIKSKPSAGKAYFFADSDDIIFDDASWTRRGRGVFRLGTTHAQIFDSEIVPDPPVHGHPVCMVGSDGGPQLGQPGDPPTWGNVIDNLTAVNTGDDSIAAFNDHTSDRSVGISIRQSYIINSFDRSINLFHTPYDVPNGIDRKTLKNLLHCNPAEPSTHPNAEPSLAGGWNDVGFSECVLYEPIGK